MSWMFTRPDGFDFVNACVTMLIPETPGVKKLQRSAVIALMVCVIATSAGCSGGSQSSTATTQPRPLIISTSTLPAALASTAYGAVLASAGGTPPISWRLSAGALPAGVTLNVATGLLAGMPTVLGDAEFTVTATDSGVPNAQAVQRSLTIVVDAAAEATVSLVANPHSAGSTVPETFIGLSYETSALFADSGFLPSNAEFQTLFSQLGPGVLRFGGNSVDQITTFDPGGLTSRGSDQSASNIYESDIDPVFAFAGAVGWKVLWSLSMGLGNGGSDAAEASYVYSQHGAQLAGFEIGNEPNLFFNPDGYRDSSWSEDNYIIDWQTNFYNPIHAAIPNAAFTAAAVTQGGLLTWTQPISSVSAGLGSKIGLLTQHLYPLNASANPLSELTTTLLSDATRSGEAVVAADLQSWSSGSGAAWRMSETGSGMQGTSSDTDVQDTFSAALWGLDYMYTLMANGASGVNFHEGRGGNFRGAPIVFGNGTITVMPLYYALLAFEQGAAQNPPVQQVLVTQSTTAGTVNLTSYATLDANDVERITVINKDTANNVALNITPGGVYTQVSALFLANPGGLSAMDGTTLGGNAVAENGQWAAAPVNLGTLTLGGSFQLGLPYASAVILILH
jgi:hypothetical protein